MAAETGAPKPPKTPKTHKAPKPPEPRKAPKAPMLRSTPARHAGAAKLADSQTLLLDTHALLWWLLDSPERGFSPRRAIADPARRVFASAAMAWELATKFRIGKLLQAEDIVVNLPQYLRKQRF